MPLTASLIAVIHSVVIGFTLWILGVPLVVPLAAVVFLAAFIPLIGILFADALAIGVALATKGWVAALTSAVVTSTVLRSRRRRKDCG
jgi:predicted PurR-regulated permease PerM